MKISFFVILMLSVFGQCLAQKSIHPSDSVKVDSLQLAEQLSSQPLRMYGFWVAGYIEPAYVEHSNGPNLGAGASLIINQQYHIGIYGSFFTGDYKKRLIFPNEFRMNYGHAGLWVGYKTHLKKALEFTGDLKVGEGKVFWERTDNFYNMFEDYALFVQPSVGIDYKVISFVALHTEVGYRLVKGLDIPAVSSSDFSGLTLNLMLKIGFF